MAHAAEECKLSPGDRVTVRFRVTDVVANANVATVCLQAIDAEDRDVAGVQITWCDSALARKD